MPWTRLLPVAVLILLGVFFALNLGRPQQTAVRSAMVGQPAPDLALPGLAPGAAGLSTADLKSGRPVLVNFFASWCLPCRVEAPHLQVLKDKGVIVHGIALRDSPENIRGFLARHGNPFARIGLDTQGQAAIAFGSSGVPETFLIDGKGIIRKQHLGEIRAEHVPDLLRELDQWR
jgi:cytochrome c biogenesis protein CcmG/thiol:disulfide interchange protein DsbE